MSRRVLLLLLFLVELGFGAVPLLRSRDTDFTAYLVAADTLANRADPYLDREHPYLYPPLLAVALIPFRALPASAAAWLWMGASAALLAFAAARLSRGAPGEGRRVIVLALLFAPFAATQWNLQANAFLLAALVLARDGLDRDADVLGGVALGAAIALKPLALFAIVGLLLAGRLRAALASAMTFAASFLLVVPFLGWKALTTTLLHVYNILFGSWPVPYAGNISLNGTLDRLFPVGATAIRHRIVAAAVLGLAAATVFLAARGGRIAGSRVIDVFLAATLLAADASWLHQSTALFPLVAAASPATAGASVLLYAAGASWRFARDAAGEGAAVATVAAALAGTAAIAMLFTSALRRRTR